MSDSPPPNGPEELARRMAELGQRYLERTTTDLEQLRTLFGAVSGGEEATFKSIETLAHRIRGSGAMFGFELVSDVAAEIELLAVDAKLGFHPDRISLQARFNAMLRVIIFVLQAAQKK